MTLPFNSAFPIAFMLLLSLLLYFNFNGLLLLIFILFFVHLLRSNPRVLIWGFLIISLYFIRYHMIINRLKSTTPNKWQRCEIVMIPKQQAVGESITTTFYCRTNRVHYFVRMKSDVPFSIEIGDWIAVTGTYAEPEPNRVPYLFNYKTYLLSKKVYYIIEADDMIHITSTRKPHYRVIRWFLSNFQGPIAHYQRALVIGDQSAFDDDFTAHTRELQISHLFVVSGFHVTSLAYAIHSVLRRFHVTKESIQRVTNLFLFGYLAINNFQPSIVRAVLMYYGTQIKRRYRLPISSAHLLAAIFLLHVLWSPLLVFHVGFQLSYAISFVLILSHERLKRYENKKIVGAFYTTLIAQLFSLPIVANFTFQYNLLSLFAAPFLLIYFNLLIFPLTLLSLVFPFLSPVFLCCFRYYEAVIDNLSSFNHFTLTIGGFDSFRLTLYYLVLYLLMYHLDEGKPVTIWGIFLILITVFYHRLTISTNVAYIDVGQGDATYIQTPFQTCTLLIDTGGTTFSNRRFHPGERHVLPYLKAHGLRSLDLFIVSHGDTDHVGDYRYILDALQVKKIVFSAYDESELKAEIMAYSQTKGIAYEELKKGDTLTCGPLRLIVHAPSQRMPDTNDQSLVFSLTIKGDHYLFTGDISHRVEEEIALDLPRDVTFLKVAHHGSKSSTSESFLQHIRPQHAIISVGNNYYGHPSSDVINRLQLVGSRIYTTQEEGTIVVRYVINRRFLHMTKSKTIRHFH